MNDKVNTENTIEGIFASEDSLEAIASRQTEQLHRHNLTTKGLADDVGMIATNAANRDKDFDSPKSKEKKAQKQLRELQIWLDAELERHRLAIEHLQEQMDVGQRLLDAYKQGERDFKGPKYRELFDATGWSKDDLKSGKAQKDMSKWNDSYKATLNKYTQLQNIERNDKNAILEIKEGTLGLSKERNITKSDLQNSFSNAVNYTDHDPIIEHKPVLFEGLKSTF